MSDHWIPMYQPRPDGAECFCPDCPKVLMEIPDEERMAQRSRAERAANHEFVLVVEVPDPAWIPPIHDSHPHALGCPRHRPMKQYCRIHHAGFYGHCHQCQLEDKPVVIEVEPRPTGDLDGSPAVSPAAPGETDEINSLKAQREVIESAIADLS